MAFIKQGQFCLVSGPITQTAFKEGQTKKGDPTVQFSVFCGKRQDEDGTWRSIYMPVEVTGELYSMVTDPDVGFSAGEIVLVTGQYREWTYNEKVYYKVTADFLCNASNVFVVAQSVMGQAEAPATLEETDEETVFDQEEPKNIFAQQIEDDDTELPY